MQSRHGWPFLQDAKLVSGEDDTVMLQETPGAWDRRPWAARRQNCGVRCKFGESQGLCGAETLASLYMPACPVDGASRLRVKPAAASKVVSRPAQRVGSASGLERLSYTYGIQELPSMRVSGGGPAPTAR